jgi:hypothetical protein
LQNFSEDKNVKVHFQDFLSSMGGGGVPLAPPTKLDSTAWQSTLEEENLTNLL